MLYTKKQYILIGSSFLILAFFGFIMFITSEGDDVLGFLKLFNILWKIAAFIGFLMLAIGMFKNDRS